MTDQIRVALVDDQAMVRAGFRMLVDSQPDLVVVAEAATGVEALSVVAEHRPDVVLMDVRMPEMDGVEATRLLAARPDAPAVVVLTTFDLDEYAFTALRAGASAFLLKDASPEDLLAAIRTVHVGDAVVAPSTTRRLLDRFLLVPDPVPTPDPASEPRLAGLTDRELEVLGLVARGLSNAEIASSLVVAETTVKTHVSRLLAKTDSRDRVHLVVLAHQCGVIES